MWGAWKKELMVKIVLGKTASSVHPPPHRHMPLRKSVLLLRFWTPIMLLGVWWGLGLTCLTKEVPNLSHSHALPCLSVFCGSNDLVFYKECTTDSNMTMPWASLSLCIPHRKTGFLFFLVYVVHSSLRDLGLHSAAIKDMKGAPHPIHPSFHLCRGNRKRSKSWHLPSHSLKPGADHHTCGTNWTHGTDLNLVFQCYSQLVL
jgi:hypothetical protein